MFNQWTLNDKNINHMFDLKYLEMLKKKKTKIGVFFLHLTHKILQYNIQISKKRTQNIQKFIWNVILPLVKIVIMDNVYYFNLIKNIRIFIYRWLFKQEEEEEKKSIISWHLLV